MSTCVEACYQKRTGSDGRIGIDNEPFRVALGATTRATGRAIVVHRLTRAASMAGGDATSSEVGGA